MSIKEQLPKLEKVPTGEKLIKGLNLFKLKYIIIQKIININLPIFVITIDTRYPERPILQARLKKLEANKLFKAKKYIDIIEPKKIVLTPPLELKTFTGDIPSDALLIQRDLAGEYFNNSKMLENENYVLVDDKKIKVFYESL